jgi:hypothetical protein
MNDGNSLFNDVFTWAIFITNTMFAAGFVAIKMSTLRLIGHTNILE